MRSNGTVFRRLLKPRSHELPKNLTQIRNFRRSHRKNIVTTSSKQLWLVFYCSPMCLNVPCCRSYYSCVMVLDLAVEYRK
jgi:hypothetical protein